MHREYHDSGRGRAFPQDQPQRLCAFHDRHHQVEDDDVGAHLPGERDRLRAVLDLSDDLDAPVGREHLPYAQTELGVIVCQHNSNGGLQSHVGRLADAPHAHIYRTPPREHHGPKGANYGSIGTKGAWTRRLETL